MRLSHNQMVGNADKCQLIVNDTGDTLHISVKNETVFNTKTSKILGVTFNNLLTFAPHINKLCQTASLKISALARISQFLSFQKKEAFNESIF